MDKEEELKDLPEAPINLAKTPTAELKNTPITTTNSASITKEIQKREGKVMVMIASTERDKHAQFVSVNGRAYNIPRDKWWPVPMSVLNVLQNSKITEITIKADPSKNDKPVMELSEVNRFSLSVKSVEIPAPAVTVPVKK